MTPRPIFTGFWLENSARAETQEAGHSVSGSDKLTRRCSADEASVMDKVGQSRWLRDREAAWESVGKYGAPARGYTAFAVATL